MSKTKKIGRLKKLVATLSAKVIRLQGKVGSLEFALSQHQREEKLKTVRYWSNEITVPEFRGGSFDELKMVRELYDSIYKEIRRLTETAYEVEPYIKFEDIGIEVFIDHRTVRYLRSRSDSFSTYALHLESITNDLKIFGFPVIEVLTPDTYVRAVRV